MERIKKSNSTEEIGYESFVYQSTHHISTKCSSYVRDEERMAWINPSRVKLNPMTTKDIVGPF